MGTLNTKKSSDSRIDTQAKSIASKLRSISYGPGVCSGLFAISIGGMDFNKSVLTVIDPVRESLFEGVEDAIN